MTGNKDIHKIFKINDINAIRDIELKIIVRLSSEHDDENDEDFIDVVALRTIVLFLSRIETRTVSESQSKSTVPVFI